MGGLDDPTDPAWDGLLREALTGQGVSSAYQPIIDLSRLTVVGYEALARFGGHLECSPSPDRWFHAAGHRGLAPALESAALRSALAHRPDLPPNCFLTVNLEPEAVVDPTVLGALRDEGDLSGLVLEITEHRPIADLARLESVLDLLRGAGALVAVDDAGAGHSGLTQILALRPAILKLDRALVEGLDRDEAKTALVEMLGVFANRIDAWLLAEGVETLSEARRLCQLGVPLAQGYLFGRPAPPWALVDEMVSLELSSHWSSTGAPELSSLVEPAPWVFSDRLHGAAVHFADADAGDALVVVLDADHRPVGALSPASVMAGELLRPLRANVHSTPHELAHRLSTRVPADTAMPVVVTDDAGRYVGVVTVTRLLSALAGAVPPAPVVTV